MLPNEPKAMAEVQGPEQDLDDQATGRSQTTSVIVRRSHRGSVLVDNNSSGSGSNREEVPSPTSLNSSGYPCEFRGPPLGRSAC
jgi:hypothetical protein